MNKMRSRRRALTRKVRGPKQAFVFLSAEQLPMLLSPEDGRYVVRLRPSRALLGQAS